MPIAWLAAAMPEKNGSGGATDAAQGSNWKQFDTLQLLWLGNMLHISRLMCN